MLCPFSNSVCALQHLTEFKGGETGNKVLGIIITITIFSNLIGAFRVVFN